MRVTNDKTWSHDVRDGTIDPVGLKVFLGFTYIFLLLYRFTTFWVSVCVLSRVWGPRLGLPMSGHFFYFLIFFGGSSFSSKIIIKNFFSLYFSFWLESTQSDSSKSWDTWKWLIQVSGDLKMTHPSLERLESDSSKSRETENDSSKSWETWKWLIKKINHIQAPDVLGFGEDDL
jgi:hypothetical protein